MKAKKLDRNLQELFRKKLENAEVTPDPSVSVKLMRRLALRELLHFNPARLNIYYLGGIIIAVIAGIMVLSDRSGQKTGPGPEKVTEEPRRQDEAEIIKPTLQDVPVSKPSPARPGGPVLTIKKTAAVVRPDSPATILTRSDSTGMQGIAPGAINESLKGKDLFNRPAEDISKHMERSGPGESILESSVKEGCAPLKVLFKNKLAEQDSCLWTFGDGGSSSNPEAEWIYDVEGEYLVVLQVFGREGPVASSSAIISVYPKPSARFEILPDKAILPDDQIRFQNYSANAVRYLWSFGDGSSSEQFEPLHRYEKFGNYNVSLKVFSEKGCSDSLVVLNAFSGSAYFIEFPNAFIPNTDGPSGGAYSSKSDESAQIFHPSWSGVSEYHLKIFSKMGVMIFETNDINIGWDGYFKGQLNNPGVYIWKVRGNYRNGEPFTKMGDVTILKK